MTNKQLVQKKKKKRKEITQRDRKRNTETR